MADQSPTRIIKTVSPIRICDNGRWTGTWFDEHDKIFNTSVYPYSEVQIEVFHASAQDDRIVLRAKNFSKWIDE